MGRPQPALAAQRKVGGKSGPPAPSACRSAHSREEEWAARPRHTAGEQLHLCNCNGAPRYEMKRHAWTCKHCSGFAVQLRHENLNLQHLQNPCNVAWFTPFPHANCEWALAHGIKNKRKE